MTGRLKIPSGTASEPAIVFSADTDTGFYRKAADTIGIAVGGAEVAEISAKGSTLTPTGIMMPYVGTTAPTGWVRANGRTMGNAASSATERANADTETLFTLLWNSYGDSVCAVSTGRGASAAADYAANKTITLPDLRGRAFFGLDDMGNSAASRLGTIITSQTTNGASGGTETHTITEAQLPSHSHAAGTLAADSNGAHTHTLNVSFGGANAAGGGAVGSANSSGGTAASNGAHTHTISGSTAASGSGTAHSNMPPAFLTTYLIKL